MSDRTEREDGLIAFDIENHLGLTEEDLDVIEAEMEKERGAEAAFWAMVEAEEEKQRERDFVGGVFNLNSKLLEAPTEGVYAN